MKKKIVLMFFVGAFLHAGGCLAWTGQASVTALNMGFVLDCDNGLFDLSTVFVDCAP